VSFARKVSKVVNSIAETKLIPIRPLVEAAPVAIAIGAIAYKYGMVIGDSIPSGWDSTMQTIGGTRIALGDTNENRNGAYVYLKKSHLNLEIDMNQGFETNTLHEFRVLVFKRRGTNPAGINYDPAYTIFLGENGKSFGPSTGSRNGTDLMVGMKNQREWVFWRDQKFTLSPTLTVPQGTETAIGFNSKYQSKKRFKIALPYFAKTKYGDVTDQPTDIDTRYGIYIFARSISKDQPANRWEVNMACSCTTFSDV
jgi:hypothetical protein